MFGNTVKDIIENQFNEEYFRTYSKEIPMSITSALTENQYFII